VSQGLIQRAAPLVGGWIFLFPATYLAHIGEEHWGGFAERFGARTGLAATDTAFLAANGAFWLLMLAVCLSAHRRPNFSPWVAVLGTVVLINVALHIGDALLLRSYSPGLATGVLLWLPLGVTALMRARRLLPRRSFRWGVALGALAHALVPAVGVGFILALGAS